TGAVGVDRPALEDPVHLVFGQTRGIGHRLADLLVALHDELAAPTVEAEAARDTPALLVEDHQRPAVAQPDVAVSVPLAGDRAAHEFTRPRLVRRVTHDEADLLPAFG